MLEQLPACSLGVEAGDELAGQACTWRKTCQRMHECAVRITQDMKSSSRWILVRREERGESAETAIPIWH